MTPGTETSAGEWPLELLLRLRLLLALAVIGLATSPVSLMAQAWVEDSFEDFADGQLDASGQNLFVSRDGSVRTIHRFDLNQDGFLDLIFNSTHDSYSTIPATLAMSSPSGRLRHSTLGSDGSQRVAVADFNGDGYLDAAFCPSAGGVQHGRRFVSICWGCAEGWPTSRCNGVLPVHRATRIAAADLNADGRPDLALLNGTAWLPGQPAGSIVRIYWNEEGGFLLSRLTDVGVPGAVDLAGADLNGDGAGDLAVLTPEGVAVFWSAPPTEGAAFPAASALRRSQIRFPGQDALCLAVADVSHDGRLDIVAGTNSAALYVATAPSEPSREGESWGVARVPAFPASHVAAGDLDGNGQMDLVLTHFSAARAAGGEAAGAADSTGDHLHILWGKPTGLSAADATKLPVRFATATAIGDLDGDQRADLAVAIHQGSRTMQADSAVFFGRGERRLERSADPLPTSGATFVAWLPPHAGHPAHAIFCNSMGATLREAVPLQVYWGVAGGFDPEKVWTIPFTSGYEATSADLNSDGYPDLVALNSGHAGASSRTDPHLGANILWGGRQGFDVEKSRTILREFNLGTSNVADLDRDGYLDLVFGQFAAAEAAGTPEVILWYGGERGLDRARRAAIPSPGRSISTVIADWNQDGDLDIAVNSFDQDVVRVFWGQAGRFDATRQLRIPMHSPIDLETADLNADGRLDLIAGSYSDRLAGHHDTGTLIFWGSPDPRQPFHGSNAQWLPGSTPIGHCVADFDGDGHLDLFSPHYHADLTRESLPSYLFWGGPQGFDPGRRTPLICDSADDALAGDFDRDGKLDLAVVCHARNDRHDTVSQVFFNDGRRFAQPRITRLPTHGPHWMWQEDMGHIAHRRWEQAYVSSPWTWQMPVVRGELLMTGDLPEGTRLVGSVRSAAHPEQLRSAAWQPLSSPAFKLAPDDRALEYRVAFHSDNGDRYPVLRRVEIRLHRR